MRRAGAVALLAGALILALPEWAIAHGIGGRLDLPVPVSYFVVAAGMVIVVSFVALTVLWPEPRLQEGPRATPIVVSTVVISRGLALLGVMGLLAVTGQVVPWLLGQDALRGRATIAPVLVWVVVWLIVPFVGSLIGNWYAAINPWNTVARWTGLGGRENTELARRVGVWPATFALLIFTWFELVSPESGSPPALGFAALAYTAYVLGAIVVLGRSSGLVAADLFTTYSEMISTIAPLGRNAEGGLVWRGWLRAVPQIRESNGFTFFVLIAIGTVTYDGASGTSWFRGVTGDLGSAIPGRTLLMVLVVSIVVGAYWAASWVAAVMVGGMRVAHVARRFAHSLIPIALAYAVAHYTTLIIFEGQQLIAAVSDPFGVGWDLFGTADRAVDFFITASEPIWYFQLGAIVVGHVLGVILAHDRALADFGEGAVRSQYAMLLLMVGLTSLGLLILAG